MTIGGSDTVIDGAPALGEGRFIVTWLKSKWPALLVEDVDADAPVAHDAPSVGQMAEFFVYESRKAFETWTASGRTDQNDDSMIHVLLGDTSTTLVHSRASTLAKSLRDAIVAWRTFW